jgi:hypothetical protein
VGRSALPNAAELRELAALIGAAGIRFGGGDVATGAGLNCDSGMSCAPAVGDVMPPGEDPTAVAGKRLASPENIAPGQRKLAVAFQMSARA